MKNKRGFVIAGVLLLIIVIPILNNGCYTTGIQNNNNGTQNNNNNETENNFYNSPDLNNYGEWISINYYGDVWRPYVVNDWMPFTNGHWIYANGNWTWNSYEPFGWIVYHYGYWYDDPYYGWVWIPTDNGWSPARVMWINYGNYTCWAPLPPYGIVYGNPWDAGGYRYWHVVRDRYFTEDDLRNYTVTRTERIETPSGSYYKRPPDRNEIERNSGRKIDEVNVRSENVKLRRGEIKRIVLPPRENKNTEQGRSRVKKDVLVPRNEYQKEHGNNKRENGNDRNKSGQNNNGRDNKSQNNNGRNNKSQNNNDRNNNSKNNNGRNNNNPNNNDRNNNGRNNNDRNNNDRNNNGRGGN